MVRQVLIGSAVLVSTTALATAQQKAPGGAPPPVTMQQTPEPARPAPPHPAQPRSVPPPVLLPMAPLTPPPAGGLTAPVPFKPGTFLPSNDRFHNGRRDPYPGHSGFPIVPGYGYGYGYGGYSYGEPNPTPTASDTAPPVAAGGLRLTGTPGDAQVFIDGYFVGTLADIEAGRPLTIPAGPHRLELRATGYQPIAVDIQITAYDTLTYRASLERQPLPPSAAAARTAGATSAAPMYLIPNCYLGNVPPRQNRLPSGCDIRQVQVLGAK
jgi:hypothetical protein